MIKNTFILQDLIRGKKEHIQLVLCVGANASKVFILHGMSVCDLKTKASL